MKTLPDYLEPGLDIVFVGINPGEYSACVGHYFANPRSRFWDAVNQSGLFDEPLGFESDYRLLEIGIGLTDVVKRPTSSPRKLRAADYRQWAPVFKERIERVSPLIVCFLGKTACSKYLKYCEGVDSSPEPGIQ
ncbi:MAG: mismatch-specific DNA-glycosylase, partial [Chloroflexi bacterium]|nr:mismatch-specific DNA-glycosylase [Chloroflexota bacterium]